MHPHGVKYGKAHEGANYADGTDMTGDYIMPGACAYYSCEFQRQDVIYKWTYEQV